MTDEDGTPAVEPAPRDILALPVIDLTPSERVQLAAVLNTEGRNGLTRGVDDIAARMLRVEDCIKDLIADLGTYAQSPLSDDAELSDLLATARGRWTGEVKATWVRIDALVSPVLDQPEEPSGNADTVEGAGNSDAPPQ